MVGIGKREYLSGLNLSIERNFDIFKNPNKQSFSLA